MVIFLTASALAITFLVIVPLIAHLLRRGGQDTVEFSLARLVLPTSKLATRRSHFADRWLFTLRALLIAALALLGASPLVRCERPTLARHQDGSVALAIVLDDSASMRAQIKGGKQRFRRAKEAAERLIGDLREGDVVSIALAGRPARLLVAATPQLRLARQLCASVGESDRSTDLVGAIELAESSLRNLPQVDHRIAVLSDLAQPIEKPYQNLWLPLPELALPVQDCGVVTASQRTNQVEVTIACTGGTSSSARQVALAQAGAARPHPSLPAGQRLDPAKSLQSIIFSPVPSGLSLRAKLDGRDDNPTNDAAPVFTGISGTVIATFSDYTTARAATGGPPLVEQALAALGGQLVVQPWSALPQDERTYADVSLLVLDDPGTFEPEVRGPLNSWLSRGGTAAAFVGARAVSDQLGMSLSPFLEGPTTWSLIHDMGLAPPTLKWLGSVAESWADIHARARLEFDSAIPAASSIRGRWRDERPAIIERQLGRGEIWTIGVPISPALSDIGLRPAFLALLNGLVERARERGLSPITSVGQPWKLEKQAQVTVTGPDGAAVPPSTPSGSADRENWFTPTLSGLYTFQSTGKLELRLAHVDPSEILEMPRTTLLGKKQLAGSTSSRQEASQYIVGSITVLVLLELFTKSSRTWVQALLSRARRVGSKRAH